MKKVFLIILILIIAGVGYIFFAPSFERIPPTVVVNGNSFWNLKKPIKITIKDNLGIKFYSISFGKYKVEKEFSGNFPKNITVEFKLPKRAMVKGKDFLKIVAVDISKWQFFAGNLTKVKKEITVDKKYPIVSIISHSYGIGRGGSALVVLKAVEKHPDTLEIVVNNKHSFKVFPFLKNNYYISLICWPVKEEDFNVKIISEDLAGNRTILPISFFRKKYSYKLSKIILNKKFIDTKVKEILDSAEMDIPEDFIARFKKMNEELRNENETTIENIAKEFKIVKVNNFKIYPFKPLKNAARKASFGDHRYYFFNGKKVSESWHLGIDLASIKNAPIKLSNNGKVVYAKYTGIYGNTLIIYHGLGLFSLYSHCSNFLVHEGEDIKKGTVIAKTGATGAVFGDHLHFGIMVQGIEVLPLEWFDKHWLKDNIFKVINDAKDIIKAMN